VVIHVVRNSRAASVVTETMSGHRPNIWVSDLYGAQQGHADHWQVCLAHYADFRVMPTDACEPTPEAVLAALGAA
jgi:hypothetical protein